MNPSVLIPDWYRDFYLRSPHWLGLREQLMRRARGHCEHCGRPSRLLQGHHTNYRELYDVTLRDLLALCRRCHEKFHARQEQNKRADQRRENFLARRKQRVA